MNKTRFLTFSLLFSFLMLQAQKKDEQAVAAAVLQLNEATVDANQSLLGQLTSEKLSYGHSNGLIEDKAAFIKALVDGISDFTNIDLTEQTIALSNGIAIVRHKFKAGTANKGQQPGTVNLAVLQVWQKENGKWLLVARQATKI